MPSGFIQLLAVGSERQYLHDNPHISFFKCIYRRYTNFYINTEELLNNEIFNTITNTTRKDILQNSKSNNLITNTSSQIIIFNIPKNGDLLIFPSWLRHGSNHETNQTDGRIVLSFNTN